MSFESNKYALSMAIEPVHAGATKKRKSSMQGIQSLSKKKDSGNGGGGGGGGDAIKRIALTHSSFVSRLRPDHALIMALSAEDINKDGILAYWNYIDEETSQDIHWPSVPLMMTLEIDGAIQFSTIADPAKTQGIGGVEQTIQGTAAVYTRLTDEVIVATERKGKHLSLIAVLVPLSLFMGL